LSICSEFDPRRDDHYEQQDGDDGDGAAVTGARGPEGPVDPVEGDDHDALAKMAATLVTNSRKAPRAWRGAPDSRVKTRYAAAAETIRCLVCRTLTRC
jgi:hypothetical protein